METIFQILWLPPTFFFFLLVSLSGRLTCLIMCAPSLLPHLSLTSPSLLGSVCRVLILVRAETLNVGAWHCKELQEQNAHLRLKIPTGACLQLSQGRVLKLASKLAAVYVHGEA